MQYRGGGDQSLSRDRARDGRLQTFIASLEILDEPDLHAGWNLRRRVRAGNQQKCRQQLLTYRHAPSDLPDARRARVEVAAARTDGPVPLPSGPVRTR